MDAKNRLTKALRKAVESRAVYPSASHPFIIAVSGGKDSMGLMYIFAEVFGARSGRIVTIDHGIRPESQHEVEGVAHQARTLGYIVDIEHLHLSKDTPNLEARARSLRYEVLHKYQQAYSAPLIVTGHHQGDQVETVLMRLFSGSSLVGLSGMRTYDHGILRPWIDVDPEDIIEYVNTESIKYYEDSSNNNTAFLRNRLRHEVLPYLKRDFPHISHTIDDFASYAHEVSEWIEHEVRAFLTSYPSGQFDARDYGELMVAHRQEIIATIYQDAHSGSRQGLSRGLIEEIDRYILTAMGNTYKCVHQLSLAKSRHMITYTTLPDGDTSHKCTK